MIHQPLSPDRVRPLNQFVTDIVSPLPCLSGLTIPPQMKWGGYT